MPDEEGRSWLNLGKKAITKVIFICSIFDKSALPLFFTPGKLAILSAILCMSRNIPLVTTDRYRVIQMIWIWIWIWLRF